MSALLVVQARMGSSRLPGKVLADLNGAPLLVFLLNRVARANVDRVVVATSSRPIDDRVAEVAEGAGFAVVRGSEHDVLSRFCDALDAYPSADVVRITADCPFSDAQLIDHALQVHRAEGADYTSNTLVRTFPDGLDVEVVRATALRAANDEATDVVEREHVTPFVYRRPERFRLAAIRHSAFLGDLRWTVDTADDLRFVQDIAMKLTSGLESWREVLALVGHRYVVPDQALLPSLTSTPGHRIWTYYRNGHRCGDVELIVKTGVGRVRLVDVAEGDRFDVHRLLAQRLLADGQVSRLRNNEDDSAVRGP